LRSSVRGDLLMKLGRNTEAEEELQRAIFLTDNLREKQLLAEKLNQIANMTKLKIGFADSQKADGSGRST